MSSSPERTISRRLGDRTPSVSNSPGPNSRLVWTIAIQPQDQVAEGSGDSLHFSSGTFIMLRPSCLLVECAPEQAKSRRILVACGQAHRYFARAEHGLPSAEEEPRVPCSGLSVPRSKRRVPMRRELQLRWGSRRTRDSVAASAFACSSWTEEAQSPRIGMRFH